MRKFLIPLLMASALVPAAALAQDRDRSAERRAERAERSERGEQPRQERRERSAPAVEVQRSLPSQASDTARERSFGHRGDQQRSERAVEVQRTRDADSDRAFGRRPIVQQDGVARDDPRRPARDRDGRQDRPAPGSTVGSTTQDGQQRGGFGGFRDRIVRDGDRVEHRRDDRRRDDHRDWRRDWRGDHRYDWRRHRDRNRWVFRIGTYYDPYRYGYRRYDIGYRMWPNYYSSNYWLNDPWEYRLPPAYGPYRWVRYYDDALLVNIYTGQVVDVIHHFFW